MSTAGTEPDADVSLAPRIQVQEHDERIIEDYPPNIAEQLQRAAFDKSAADTFVKHHRSLHGAKEQQVVKVELDDDQLRISVKDVVGVVNLTPYSKLQINPKIGWNDILEIFLTVGEQDRSLDYHGVPIRDFLADDLRIEDIFVVVAVNYLNSLEYLFRNGFIREFDTRRVDAIDARGQIDIERSLKNHAFSDGVPKQHFVQKIVDYNTPANILIYRAGLELRRLFQQYADTYDHHGYYRIFSRLEETLQRLESRGIRDTESRLSDFSEISLFDLPHQRHYYKQALNISKTILSSSIGEPLDYGREDLTMDYLLSMENLFERYANIVLKEQSDYLQESPLYTGISDVTVDKETHHLFIDTDEFTHQPDHVLRRDGDPIAVIDTKYYAEDHSPLKDTYARSRLLGYAYHLEVDEVAFLCPLADPERHSFADRPGALEVISPRQFTINTFKECIREYLRNVLNITTDDTLRTDVEKYGVCHPEVSVSDFDDVIGEEQLEPSQLQDSSLSIFIYFVNRHSNQVSRFGNLTIWRPLYKAFESYLEEETAGYDYVVPLFIPADIEIDSITIENGENQEKPDEDWDEEELGERILLHCLAVDESGDITAWHVPKPLSLDWSNNR